MKKFTIVGVFVFTFICWTNQLNISVPAMYKKCSDFCRKSLSPESTILMEYDHSDNEEIRCYKKCTLEHMGIFSEGKMNILRLEKLMEFMNPKESGEAILKAVKSCSNATALNNNTECGVAALYHDCMLSVKGALQ